MKILSACFLLFLAIGSPGNAGVPEARDEYVPDELLVKFSASTDALLETRAHALAGAVKLETLGGGLWQRVRIPAGLSLDDAMARYRMVPNVAAVQPNFYYRFAVTPNDPDFPHSGMYGLTKISAPQAWDLTTGSSEVVVANIDTGMRLTHEDLQTNIWTNPGEIAGNGADDDNNGFIDDVNGWDFRFDDSDPTDQHGHGTHVGGTIGAAGNNGLGVVGVNWNVKIMAIKIYSQTGGDTTSAMLINAYNYVRMMKERGVNIRVTNNSYGGCQEACGYDQATRDAIEALGEAGILNVFAAGNSGTNIDINPFYPASYTLPSIISVGGSNSSDLRVYNFGVESVDLAAPGVGIRSTTNGSDSSYGPSSGTSMATPHVSGAAALLAAHNPSLSAASLKATLMNNVDQLKQFDGFVKSGGRLNVFAALQNPTVCEFNPSVNSIFAPTKGGVFTIDVTAAPNCDYSVRSDVNWITVLSPKDLSGNAAVMLRVTVNPTITRSATVTLAGEKITISQSRTGKL
jgi:subtilisin family serine protease